MFVQPAAHDGGVGLGAAYVVARQLAPERFSPRPMTHALWGPEFSDEEIAAALAERGLTGDRLTPDELATRVASAVARGAVVGWHQGRAEVGPRALGGRSLIGDPRRRSTLVRLNQINNREMWRPLAPSVLAGHFEKFFDGTPNPFMIVAASVREEVRHRIPAVVHIDGSARPQIVDPPTSRCTARCCPRSTPRPVFHWW